MPDIVSVEIAQRLQELGLWHPIVPEDYYMADDKGPYLYPWQTPVSYTRSNYLWFPRLDQVMEEIAMRLHPPTKAIWQEVLGSIGYGGRYYEPSATSVIEAAGLALVKIMEVENA